MSGKTQVKVKDKQAADKNAGSAKDSGVTAWVLAGVGGIALLGIVGFLTYTLAFYQNIYSNVYIDNVPVGGISQDEAAAMLGKGLSQVYAGKSIELTVDEYAVSISAEEVGAGISASDTAKRAYLVGREGSIFSRLGAVISSPFSRVDIESTSEFYIDREALSDKIQNMALSIDQEVTQYAVDIREKDIVIKNAKAGRALPKESLLEFLTHRFETRDFSPLRYETEKLEPQPLNLDSLYAQIHVPPKDAYVDLTDKNNIRIMPEKAGVSFDLEAAERLIETDVPEIIIPLVSLPAEINMASLEESLFRDELGSFTTYLNTSNLPRTSNIRLAASNIDGTILMPGEVFSYNEYVGKRTAERGFQEAGAYVNGKLVPETGGGICQLSSTLYVAALTSNLKIVERQNHSMTVAYLKAGLDATVNWGTIDFRFENDTKYPLRVSAAQKGGAVTVSITGTMETPFTVEIETDPVSYNAFSSKTIVNPELEPGTQRVASEGHNGSTVQSYRVVKDKDGKVLSRTAEAKSVYRRVDQVIEAGPDVPVTNPSNPPAENPGDIPPGTEATPEPEPPVNTPEPSASPEPSLPAEPNDDLPAAEHSAGLPLRRQQSSAL